MSYRAQLFVCDADWEIEAAVQLKDGEVALSTEEGPAWLREQLRALLRTQWRAVTREGGRWPRRVSRWRAQPQSDGAPS